MEALILVNTVPGRELEIMEKMARLPGVRLVFMLYGAHDLAVLVEAQSIERLKTLVSDYLRRVEGVLTTTTLVVAAKEEPRNPAF